MSLVDRLARFRGLAGPEVTSAAVAAFVLLVTYAFPSELRLGSRGSDPTSLWHPISAFLLVLAYSVRWRSAPLIFVAIVVSRSLDEHTALFSPLLLLVSLFVAFLYVAAGTLLRRSIPTESASIRTSALWWFLLVVTALSAALAVTNSGMSIREPLSWYPRFGMLSVHDFLATLNGMLGVGAFFILYTIPELMRKRLGSDDHARRFRSPRRTLRFLDFVESFAQLLALLACFWLAASSELARQIDLIYVLFLPVVWIAVRHRLRGTVLALFFVNACLAVVFQSENGLSSRHSLLELQVFTLLLTATGLCLGALAAERAAARDELAERTTFLHALIENNPLAIIVYRTDGTVSLTNPAFQRMFGFSHDETYGRRIDEIVKAPDGSGEEIGLTESTVGGEPVHLTTSRSRKDGHTLRVELHGVPLIVGDRLAGGIGIYKDISEQTRLEEELLMAQKLQAVGQLAGGVAHDFNNILGIIQGYSESMLLRMERNDPLRDNAAEILEASERATSLTRQLLAFGRKQVIQPRVFDIDASVNDMAKMLGRLIGEDIRLVIRSSPNSGRIKADPSQFEQVIMNLVVNARDAMPKGGTLTIETGYVYLHEQYAASYAPVPPGRYVMLAVCDTGMGMSAETRARIFDPFFTTKEKGKGTGLGLATVHGIVHQAGGHIRVDSELGHGSAFRVFFPTADNEDAEDLKAEAADPKILRGSETVLLLEDEPAFRKMIADFLGKAGYSVLAPDSASEATQLAQLHPTPIHLMLSDVIMPEINGPELARFLQVLRPGMRVLFMSGYTDGALEQKAVLSKDVAFIQKPFSWRALSVKMREILDPALVHEPTHPG